MRALCRILVAGCVLCATYSARACTACDSPNGRALRAGLFDGHLLHTALVVIAPVPVLAAAVGMLYLVIPRVGPATLRPNVFRLPDQETP